MHRVFLPSCVTGDTIVITGDEAGHIIKSLRMKTGERFVVCDGQENEWLCEIIEIFKNSLCAGVLEKRKSTAEPGTKVSLFVSIPKWDKMEDVIQKAVEIGVHEIHPVISERCISRPDKSSAEKKLARWQAISKSAAMQSDRGIIPQVFESVSFENAVKTCKNDARIILYEIFEQTSKTLKDAISTNFFDIAIFSGPEGGYGEDEIRLAQTYGIAPVTLGGRILRCETAPVLALCAVLFQKNDF